METSKRKSKPTPKGQTSKSAWKHLERQVAKMFGTDRVPLSGMAKSLKTSSDSLHHKLYIECKHKKQYSTSSTGEERRGSNTAFFTSFEGVNKLATKKKKIPIVIYRKKNTRGVLVCFREKHLLQVAEHFSMQWDDNKFLVDTVVKSQLAICSLYIDSAEKAKQEGKIPLVAIKGKGLQTIYFICSPTHLKQIAECYEHRNTIDKTAGGTHVESKCYY